MLENLTLNFEKNFDKKFSKEFFAFLAFKIDLVSNYRVNEKKSITLASTKSPGII